MSNVNDGGSAFPMQADSLDDNWCGREEGMSLRDYFAAKAMPACLADYALYARIKGWDENWKMGIAMDAYAMADAMLKAREVKP